MHSATHPVGIIGVGLVGLALVERLRAARIKVLGYDINPVRRDALAKANGIPAASANDVFGACDNVILALYDDDQTEAVITEALPVVAPGSAIVDCGNGDPDRTVALAVRLARRGCCLLDAPLSGSSQQIREGDAVMIVGGERDAFDALLPVLAAISARRFHLGPVGSGSRARLAINLMLGLNRAVLAETLVFAESLGLDLRTFVDLVRATPAHSRATDAKAERMIEGDYMPPQSRLGAQQQEIALIAAAAHRAGRALPLSGVLASLLTEAVAAGDRELDTAAIIEAIRRRPLPARGP
jgi:3-hydroxyisobutyrate dehydrogenase-like beta-hydroxyacid dehydrogenase